MRSLAPTLVRSLALASFISFAGAAAHAQLLEVNGKFGYLGEYELSATVNAQSLGGRQEFSGPMIVRHVGLCTHNGPNESQGEITLQFNNAKSRVEATLAFDGQRCRYNGRMSEKDVGELFCSDTAIPVSLWFKM